MSDGSDYDEDDKSVMRKDKLEKLSKMLDADEKYILK